MKRLVDHGRGSLRDSLPGELVTDIGVRSAQERPGGDGRLVAGDSPLIRHILAAAPLHAAQGIDAGLGILPEEVAAPRQLIEAVDRQLCRLIDGEENVRLERNPCGYAGLSPGEARRSASSGEVVGGDGPAARCWP